MTAPAAQDQKAGTGGLSVTFPVIIVEGMETSDGRFIVPGALQARALPMPILAMTGNPEGGDGHAGAEVIGRLDTITRVPGPQVTNRQTGQPFPEGTFVWTGTGEIDPDMPAAALVEKRYLTGNSADLSDVDAELIWSEDDEDGEMLGELEQIRVTRGFISGTTVCPFPAFAEAYIVLEGEELTPADDMPEELVAAAFPAWRSPDVGDDCLPCQAGQDAVVASVGAEKVPSADYFAELELEGPTPLTIGQPDADGFREVYGHLAEWGTCHIGFSGQCRTAPRSRSGYAYFLTGAHPARDSNGELVSVPVGRLTYDTGHAPTSAGGRPVPAAPAAAHYDNTGSIGAYVTAGEDDYGIWVHGIVAPGADVAKLSATPPSGDWRPIGGSLELVAALHVNTPGFPVPRVMVAGGQVQALVAAGVVAPADRPAARTVADADAVADAVLAKLDLRARRDAALAQLDRLASAELEQRRTAALAALA